MSTAYLSAAHASDRRGDAGPHGGDAGRPSIAAAPLLIAGLCLAGLALTWVMADLVPATHVRDAVALHDFTRLGRPRVDSVANGLLHLLDPLLYTVWAALLVIVAFARGRVRVAVAVAVVLPLAPLTAEVLKPLLAHPHQQIGWDWINEASWPSGHATAAATLVLCALLVAPARLRLSVVALGVPFVVAVGCSLMILAWHMPSDVIGGYLLAALWASLAVAALRATETRSPSARRGGGARAVRARVP